MPADLVSLLPMALVLVVIGAVAGVIGGLLGVGGGIVYDSRAADEWEECLWKARVLNPD